jgi:HD superfamily phosphodiesterase
MSKKTKTALDYLVDRLKKEGCEEVESIILDRDEARIIKLLGKPEEDYPDIDLTMSIPRRRVLEYDVYTIHEREKQRVRVIYYRNPKGEIECKYTVYPRR